MRFSIIFIPFLAFSLLSAKELTGQCNSTGQALSKRITNYHFDVEFAPAEHMVSGKEKIIWFNESPDTVQALEMYMYLNSFKNISSSFLKGASNSVMGQDLRSRTPETFGFVDIYQIFQEGQDLCPQSYFIQRDDGNPDDESVLRVILNKAILPGDSLVLDLNFTSKLPKTIARSGYSSQGLNLFCHWYPKLGVYEMNESGEWNWNCHQFLRQMEFYGEFGNYSLRLRAPERFVIGASGCRIQEDKPGDGYKSYEFLAEDVIDFAWCAYEDFRTKNIQWKHVDIQLLYPPHHEAISERLLHAAIGALEYYAEHLGLYPYKTLTIMDPPAHALRSGFMEYPTFITGGSFYGFPKGIRTLESLVIHELSHQYFMGILASNEKEAPWMDEGFVTFYEDLIMESLYSEHSSLFDIAGYKVGNAEFTRNEYSSLDNKRIDVINSKSWEIKSAYKSIIYSKTATFLQTLRRSLGPESFDRMMKSYYHKNSFRHPREEDFRKEVLEAFAREKDNILGSHIEQFFDECVSGALVCDYRVNSVHSNPPDQRFGWYGRGEEKFFVNELPMKSDSVMNVVVVERRGDLVSPVELLVKYEDGTEEIRVWDGKDALKNFYFPSDQRIVGAVLDPHQKLYLDVDLNNNSYFISMPHTGAIKYASRVLYWVQNILQGFSFAI